MIASIVIKGAFPHVSYIAGGKFEKEFGQIK